MQVVIWDTFVSQELLSTYHKLQGPWKATALEPSWKGQLGFRFLIWILISEWIHLAGSDMMVGTLVAIGTNSLSASMCAGVPMHRILCQGVPLSDTICGYTTMRGYL